MDNFSALVEEKFSKNNWRITIAVRALSSLLEKSPHLLSVLDLQKKLKKEGIHIDTSTVYRVLEKLTSLALVHEFQGQWKKCSCPDNQSDEHHFLICEECHGVEEIFLDYKDAIAEQLKNEKKFHLKHVHLGFFGECKDCQ